MNLAPVLGVRDDAARHAVEHDATLAHLEDAVLARPRRYVRGRGTLVFQPRFGSDERFSKWKLTITDNINFKLPGRFRYRLGVGGFIDTGSNVQVPDYYHFNGNASRLAAEYRLASIAFPSISTGAYSYPRAEAAAVASRAIADFLKEETSIIEVRLVFFLPNDLKAFYKNHKFDDVEQVKVDASS